MQENELIERICQWQQQGPRLKLGIGDDAALLRTLPQANLVVTTDLIADGTHFDSKTATPAQIGRKAMAVNLSDLAAMASQPIAAFVSLLLPRATGLEYAETLMQSISDLANEFQCVVAGGDTNTWDGKLAINVTLVGETTARGPLRRNGARPGDELIVTGSLGGSIAGHHFSFSPRINEALLLHERYELHAGMDISDGLAMDLRRLCQQSSCGAEVIVEQLPISKALEAFTDSRDEQVSRALGDGEDFELLLAVPPESARQMLSEQPLDIP